MIKSALIVSRKDQASVNMLNILLKNYNFRPYSESTDKETYYKYKNIELIVLNEEMIYCNYLEKICKSERIIFLSKHQSKSGKPTLTAHFLGNPSNEAPYGGEKMQIAPTCPNLLKNYIINLEKQKNNLVNYEISLEATHHGPTNISKPCLFIEIGSQIKQWQDDNAANIVVNTIMESIENENDGNKIGFGLGGPHYSKKFTELLLKSEYSIAGYISRHYIEYFNQELLFQILNKCEQNIKYVIIDKKGLGKEKKRIINLLKENELEIITI